MLDPNTRRSFGTLVAAAFVDGTLSEPERQVLHRKATEMNVPIRDMNDMIAQGGAGKLPVAVPPTREAREELLNGLIDIACADGRLEAPEHHLLAKFASHLGLGLPDLRARVRQRMEMRPPDPPPPQRRIEEVRVSTEKDPVFQGSSSPPPMGSPIPDIPPVTLQLIKQALMFENLEDALHYVERMMGVPRPEAQQIVEKVLAAFPDVKPASRRITPGPKSPTAHGRK